MATDALLPADSTPTPTRAGLPRPAPLTPESRLDHLACSRRRSSLDRLQRRLLVARLLETERPPVLPLGGDVAEDAGHEGSDPDADDLRHLRRGARDDVFAREERLILV